MSTAAAEGIELLQDERAVWRGAPRARLAWPDVISFAFGLFFLSIFVLPITLTSDSSSSQEEPASQATTGGVVFLLFFVGLSVAFAIFMMVGP
jgi:hypothetical protein